MYIVDSTQTTLTGFPSISDLALLPGFTFTITEDLGASLPVMSVDFNLNYIVVLATSLVRGTVVTLTFQGKVSDWILMHFSTPTPDTVNLLLVPNYQDYVDKAKQSYIKGTSLDAINQLTTINVQTNNVITNDSQIWIQDNICDREFVVSTLLHSNMPDDHLLFATNIFGTLNIINYNTLIKTNTITIGGTNGDITNQYFTVEMLPVSLYLKANFTQYAVTADGELDSYIDSDTGAESNSFRVAIDCGNTYSGYWSSFNNNISKYCNMMSVVYGVTNSRANIIVSPLDVIKVLSYAGNDYNTKDAPSIVGNNFVVTKTITKRGTDNIVTQQIWFGAI